MAGCLIMCKGLTRAQIMQKMLIGDNIPARITRPPQSLLSQGCGYAVRIDEQNLNRARTVLRNGRIPLGKVYLEQGGDYREMGL